MQISANGIDLIKKFEGCFLKTYDDGTGVLTIGYGHTHNVKWGDIITVGQANELLLEDLKQSSNDVQILIDNETINFSVNQNMFDALTSFDFNVGKSNLITLVKDRDEKQVAEKILLYVYASGKRLEGLAIRRQAERALFLSEPKINIKESVKMVLIKFGEKSRRVKVVQAMLNYIMQWQLMTDGEYGENTLRAVKEYQRINDLSIDGIIGEQTIDKMLSDTKHIIMKG